MSLFDYSDEEIQAVKPGHLLSMEIEFTRRCNYRCPYCYAVDESMDYSTEMSPDEIRNAIEQARELGARKIVILGGEPLVYPKLREMIRFIVSLGMGAEIFTNGALMTEELADFFYKQGCRVVVKLNSFNAEVHDRLTAPGFAEKSAGGASDASGGRIPDGEGHALRGNRAFHGQSRRGSDNLALAERTGNPAVF